jgi:hypothetical protein
VEYIGFADRRNIVVESSRNGEVALGVFPSLCASDQDQ